MKATDSRPNPGALLFGAAFLLGALCLALGAVEARAAQAEVVRVSCVNALIEGKVMRLDDSPGHVMAVTRRQGRAIWGKGEQVDYQAYSTIDAWVGQKGFRKGYSVLTFKDGSRIHLAWEARSKRNQADLPSASGTGRITGGKGRFKGITGAVVFSGVQQKPSAQDPARTWDLDLVLIYTLP